MRRGLLVLALEGTPGVNQTLDITGMQHLKKAMYSTLHASLGHYLCVSPPMHLMHWRTPSALPNCSRSEAATRCGRRRARRRSWGRSCARRARARRSWATPWSASGRPPRWPPPSSRRARSRPPCRPCVPSSSCRCRGLIRCLLCSHGHVCPARVPCSLQHAVSARLAGR